MTSNERRRSRLAAVGLAMLLVVALSACGSSSGGAKAGAASASVVKAVTKLTTCLSAHGVKVPTPVTRRGVRTTIRDLPSARQSAVLTACQTQIDALLALRPKR